MTINNLNSALISNNSFIVNEINLIIDYLNNANLNQAKAHFEIIDDLNNINQRISNLDNTGSQNYQTLQEYIDSHKNNLVIHVTQNDKDLWNATLQNAKDYAKSLFDRLTSFEIIKCTELPTEDIKEMTIYFLQINPEQDDLYEEYMYIDGEWEKIGNTRIDLSDYVTKTMLQSAVDSLNQTITNKEQLLNQSIEQLLNKHNDDILDIIQRIKNLKDNLDLLDIQVNRKIDQKEYLLLNKINNLETKHDREISNLITKHDNDIEQIQQSLSQVHTHDNKSVLDNLTQDVIDNSHLHTNKTILDKLNTDPKDNLYYDDKKITYDFTEQEVQALIDYLWGIENHNFLTKDNKYILTKDNKVFTAKVGDS